MNIHEIDPALTQMRLRAAIAKDTDELSGLSKVELIDIILAGSMLLAALMDVDPKMNYLISQALADPIVLGEG